MAGILDAGGAVAKFFARGSSARSAVIGGIVGGMAGASSDWEGNGGGIGGFLGGALAGAGIGVAGRYGLGAIRGGMRGGWGGAGRAVQRMGKIDLGKMGFRGGGINFAGGKGSKMASNQPLLTVGSPVGKGSTALIAAAEPSRMLTAGPNIRGLLPQFAGPNAGGGRALAGMGGPGFSSPVSGTAMRPLRNRPIGSNLSKNEQIARAKASIEQANASARQAVRNHGAARRGPRTTMQKVEEDWDPILGSAAARLGV